MEGETPDPKNLTAEELAGSGVFCILPWTNLNVREDGMVSVCCMSHSDATQSSLRGSTLGAVWNSPEIREMRRNMLSGKKSRQCSKCYELERANLLSLRKERNQEIPAALGQVAATRSDGSLASLSCSSLELSLSNTCNFRCRYCLPRRSTAWYDEHAGLWGPPKHSRIVTATDDFPALYREIETLLPQLRQIHFAGGEPLVSDWHYEILRLLARHGRFDVRLSYSTNFSHLIHKGTDVLALWSQFEAVAVGASLDASGRRGEYIRKGQDWRRTEENRERMLRLAPRARFNIAPTLSVMNVLHLPDFHREWLDKGFINANGINIGVLFGPLEYRAQILPDRLKRQAAEKYRAHAADLLARFGKQGERAASLFLGVVDFLMQKDLTCLLREFRQRIRELDASRGESFAEVFPELSELMTGGKEEEAWPAAGAPELPPGAGDSPARSLEDLFSLDVQTEWRDAKAHLWTAAELWKAGKREEAVREYEEVLALDCEYADVRMQAHTELGRLLLEEGRLAEAEKNFKALLELPVENVWKEIHARSGLARVYRRLARPQEALVQWQQVLRTGRASPEEQIEAHTESGHLHVELGRLDAAEESFKKLFSLETASPYRQTNAHLGLAMLHWRRGDPQSAAGEYQKVLAVSDAPEGVRSHAQRCLEQLASGAGER